MIVECLQCHTKFKIGDEKVSWKGVKVRCSKCKSMFLVRKGGVIEPVQMPGKDDSTPDVSRVPTKVSPAPESRKAAGEDLFPVPSPPVAGVGKSRSVAAPGKPAAPSADDLPTLVDQIDLDADIPAPFPAPAAALPPHPRITASPAPAKAQAAPPAAGLGDDPFAGIDLLVPGRAASPSVPAAPAKTGAKPAATAPDPLLQVVGRATEDLFDRLGDPFAGILPQPAAPAPVTPRKPPVASRPPPVEAAPLPPPLPPAPASVELFDDPFQAAAAPLPDQEATDRVPIDDPFAGIDIEPSQSAGGQASPANLGGAILGNDPFGQTDSGGPAGAEVPSGLELDQEGNLVGEKLPAPPPPQKMISPDLAEAAVRAVAATRSAGPVPARTAAQPLPMAEPAPPPTRAVWLYRLVFGFTALVIALLMFVSFRAGGMPDLTSWSTYVEAFTGRRSSSEVPGDLQAVKIASTSYPNRDNRQLVVLWGEVRNQSPERKAALAVHGRLLDIGGKVLNQTAAPAGISLTPQDVFGLTDGKAVAELYRARLPAVAGLEVLPGESIPFMLVFFDHPEEMDGVRFQVIPQVSQDSWRGLPPPPPPDPPAVDSGEKKPPVPKPAPRGKPKTATEKNP